MKSKTNVDFSPRGYLIRYPLLVDACVKRFIDDWQDSFKKTNDGSYKLKRCPSKKSLVAIFEKYLDEEIKKLLSKAVSENGFKSGIDKIVIVDSGSERRESFAMLESDIDISLEKIERVLNSLFNKRMAERQCNPDSIYCKHKMMLSSDWEKLLRKKIFGGKNLIVLNEVVEPKCIVEKKKEISELSKMENSLIVQESSAWLLSSF